MIGIRQLKLGKYLRTQGNREKNNKEISVFLTLWPPCWGLKDEHAQVCPSVMTVEWKRNIYFQKSQEVLGKYFPKGRHLETDREATHHGCQQHDIPRGVTPVGEFDFIIAMQWHG